MCVCVCVGGCMCMCVCRWEPAEHTAAGAASRCADEVILCLAGIMQRTRYLCKAHRDVFTCDVTGHILIRFREHMERYWKEHEMQWRQSQNGNTLRTQTQTHTHTRSNTHSHTHHTHTHTPPYALVQTRFVRVGGLVMATCARVERAIEEWADDLTVLDFHTNIAANNDDDGNDDDNNNSNNNNNNSNKNNNNNNNKNNNHDNNNNDNNNNNNNQIRFDTHKHNPSEKGTDTGTVTETESVKGTAAGKGTRPLPLQSAGLSGTRTPLYSSITRT